MAQSAQLTQSVAFHIQQDHFEIMEAEHCHCRPLALLPMVSQAGTGQDEDEIDYSKVTPATPELNASIRIQLSTFFPRTTPLSILLLHTSQLEHIHISPQSAVLHKRLSYHAPASFLDQVLVNVQRTIRDDDQLLIHKGAGAAVIFPHVDEHGIFNILERIYRNVTLLQAETVIPPLKRETDVVMGVGTYPADGPSLEHLLHHVSITARRFTLRPAITTHLWDMSSNENEKVEVEVVTQPRIPIQHGRTQSDAQLKGSKTRANIPYMQLPTQLPMRLKQLIPYSTASTLRCVPVGRDHHCLTVAMVDPTDSSTIYSLHELTGLTIYPVFCDINALDALLTNKW